MTKEDVFAALERHYEISYMNGDLAQTYGVEPSVDTDLGTYSIYVLLQCGDYFTKAYLCLFDNPDAAEAFANNMNASWKRVSKRERMHVYERRLQDADENL